MDTDKVYDPHQQFLSFRKTQELLDCSRSFLYGLIERGSLKPKHIGRKPYFILSDITKLLEDEKPSS